MAIPGSIQTHFSFLSGLLRKVLTVSNWSVLRSNATTIAMITWKIQAVRVLAFVSLLVTACMSPQAQMQALNLVR